jgi:hypothetical protein
MEPYYSVFVGLFNTVPSITLVGKISLYSFDYTKIFKFQIRKQTIIIKLKDKEKFSEEKQIEKQKQKKHE